MQARARYDVRITSNLKVILTIILVPTLTITPLILLGVIYGPAMPEWLEYVIIYGLLIAGGVLTLFIVKRASPVAVMTLDDDGFSIDFVDKGFFARRSFRVLLSDVRGFSIEGNDRYDYMAFRTSKSPSSFNISAVNDSGAGVAAFDELKEKVSSIVAGYNANPAEVRVISGSSIYASGFMKAVAVLWLLIILAVTINNLFMPAERHVPLARVLVIAVIGVPFVWKVYVASAEEKRRGT